MHSTRRASAFFAVAAATLFVTAASAENYVVVKGERVNLRAAPAPEAEVVGQVSTPDRLVLQGSLADPWVKVTPPDRVDLWIFAELVTDGKVNVNKAQVRAGAGLNYHAVGQLQRGDAVTVRGKFGDWLKIAPVPTAAVYVTNCYVEACAPPPAPAPTSPAPAPTVAATVADPKPAPPVPVPDPPAAVIPLVLQAPTPPEEPAAPPPLIDDTIVPAAADAVSADPRASSAPQRASVPGAAQARQISRPPRRSLFGDTGDTTAIGPAQVPASRLRNNAEQAIPGSYSGILALSPTGAHPTRFRLVVFSPSGQPQTVCYVLGNNRQLDSLKGSTFTIEGAVYWFKDTDLPTVFAQNMLRHQRR